jgi:hypothetical protein
MSTVEEKKRRKDLPESNFKAINKKGSSTYL